MNMKQLMALLASVALVSGVSAQYQSDTPGQSPDTGKQKELGAPSHTEGQTQKAPAAHMGAASQQMMLHKGSDLLGKEVKNAQGENLGTVEDVVLGQNYQEISYIALQSGGFLGIGGKLHAVPVNAFKIGADGQLTLDISKDQFQQSAGFDSNNWPDKADPNLTAMVGGRPAMTGQVMENERRPATTRDRPVGQQVPAGAVDISGRRLSNFMDMGVNDQQGNKIGEIEDVILDVQAGRVSSVVVTLDAQNALAAVPAGSVQVTPGDKAATLNVERSKLEQFAFQRSEARDLASRDFARRVYEHYGQQPYWTTGAGASTPQQPRAAR